MTCRPGAGGGSSIRSASPRADRSQLVFVSSYLDCQNPLLVQKLSLAVIAFLLFVLGQYYVSSRRLAEQIPVLEQRATRFEWQTGLIGKVLPAELLGRADSVGEQDPSLPGSADAWRAIWIVDAERCIGCLADVYEWNLLPRQGVRASLIISGVDAGAGEEAARRAGIKTAVILDPHGLWRSAFRMPLSSLRLLVHPDGTILLADTRNPAATCYWHFAAQVRRLLNPSDTTPLISRGRLLQWSLGDPPK